MTAEELCDNVNYYQGSGLGHPLTCGGTFNGADCRENLQASMGRFDKVQLSCRRCGYTQQNIPKLPSIKAIKAMQVTMSEMYNEAMKEVKDED